MPQRQLLTLLSVDAAALPTKRAAGKTFRFQIVDPAKGKQFLGPSATATLDESKALVCELVVDVLKCAGKGFAEYPKAGDMVKFAPSSTANAAGWSIDDKDNIVWKSGQPDIKFSIGIGSANDVYAETCPHHWTQHGSAKAVWIDATVAA